ncbi:MAG: hypothetical protein ACKOAZ_09245 [Ilumatobacteraceae bacterium]
MKSRLAAVLSVSGVLVAGSAAALVNTQVLRHTNDSALSGDTSGVQSNAPVTAGTVAISVAGTLVAGTDTIPVSTDAQLLLPAGAPNSSTGASTTRSTATSYRVATSGTVILDTVGGVLTVRSATPSSGWQLVSTSKASPTHAQVVFESSTARVVFDANMLYGVVGTSVEVYPLDDDDSTTTTIDEVGTTTTDEPDDDVIDDD